MVILRKQNGFDQIAPIFKDWMLQIKSLDQRNIQKTVKTYLPSKVTDIETIQQYSLIFRPFLRM